jgi:hypothetical protein
MEYLADESTRLWRRCRKDEARGEKARRRLEAFRHGECDASGTGWSVDAEANRNGPMFRRLKLEPPQLFRLSPDFITLHYTVWLGTTR